VEVRGRAESVIIQDQGHRHRRRRTDGGGEQQAGDYNLHCARLSCAYFADNILLFPLRCRRSVCVWVCGFLAAASVYSQITHSRIEIN
jgi:hypothetical protein